MWRCEDGSHGYEILNPGELLLEVLQETDNQGLFFDENDEKEFIKNAGENLPKPYPEWRSLMLMQKFPDLEETIFTNWWTDIQEVIDYISQELFDADPHVGY